ncbi:LacI family DNA-binding transcriptional regulator [Reinekea blandensis]|uniref:Transcriptional regulator n=1 Tax=Reinekea blandensis MED297 TaxID=314283 RepID=A4BGD2_9GAMM|nr:LacI family DNA-binding transcriptional regulator [Reinekea blandensis]EAR08738.1 transcriptional regulator [Reinekea sp. MED297] [Reinekea blandensis MED297]
MSTIKQVASQAGVAQSTVSRVLNGGSVSKRTQERVLHAIETLNFKPNTLARSLATNRTGTFGMVVGDLAGPFFGSLMQEAEAVIRQHDKLLIIARGNSRATGEREAIEYLREKRCDVLLLQVDELTDAELIALSKDIPIVVMNRHIPELAGQCVYLDNQLGAELATSLLIERGHRHIAHLSGPMTRRDSQQRVAGFHAALARQPHPLEPAAIVEGDYQVEGGYAATCKLLADGVRFSALFSANDNMAIGAIEALREHNLRVPDDVSVIGFDDVFFARHLTPKLTTIEYPVAELGRIAAERALKLMDGTLEPTGLAPLAPRLITRESVINHQDADDTHI